MRVSQMYAPTLREVPAEAEVVSHQLMLRAGFIRKAAGGVYSYLPLAWRVLKKIENIVREEMDDAGAQELLMPIVQPAEIWQESGRWDVYGQEMFKLMDRHERPFCLGPTHEEMVTTLIRQDVRSYRQLPLNVYQIQNKYRDEKRPRFGLLRGREFIMKDAYSFDKDEAGLEVSYKKMYDAYNNVFTRCGLNFRPVEADSGAIGGSGSHEFTVIAGSGENEIVFCSKCDYAAELRLLHEQLQRRHNDGCDDDRDDGRHIHRHAADGDRRRAEDLVGDHARVRAHGRDGLREVFQQQAHGDRRDERRHACALAPHRPVGHQLDHNAHERADHDRRKHPRPRRQPHAVQQDRHGEIQRIAADHDEVAVRKVNESDNAVNHRIAERHERIDAAEAQPDDELL